MNEIEMITKALKDAYNFVKEQEQTKETVELLISLFKAEILVKNCSIPDVIKSVCVHESGCNLILTTGRCVKQCPNFQPKQTVL